MEKELQTFNDLLTEITVYLRQLSYSEKGINTYRSVWRHLQIMKLGDTKRTNETTDYPRLGYVAFSRAERLLCFACLEKVKATTLNKITDLEVVFYKAGA